jgi:TRAP-type mannitol/chloroaromatic compound transport system substrate-binding protein
METEETEMSATDRPRNPARRQAALTLAAGAGVGAAVLAAPAITQAQPAVRWRCTTGVPRALDTVFDTATGAAQRISDATGGRFTMTVAPVGEIVPMPQAVDAVVGGTVEAAHVYAAWYTGRDPTWAFGTAIPFGMNTRLMNAWWKMGGGETMFNDWLRPQGLQYILAGNTAAQMGGWFRREIRTLADVRGLKFRIAGLGGQIWHAAGAVPQLIPPGDIYPALERGTIDAVELTTPYDEEKLGFHRVARFYYYPGFFSPNGGLGFLVNNRAWEALPAEYRHIFTAAAHEANTMMVARLDSLNAAALRRLVAGGTQLRAFPMPLLRVFHDHALRIYSELSAANADFGRFYAHYTSFQREGAGWLRINEDSINNMMSELLRPR